ncbi:unnamed protein product [Tetraodon nigroviridis]|uniref:(spotted green pufferfish) hypothetical protein n=1 Tax=Tetraodon nigroviridis TaxID=99883 RepID=Q4SD65_TETNG|nr:unnamed protein product [Tetraodon nigroviridis]
MLSRSAKQMRESGGGTRMGSGQEPERQRDEADGSCGIISNLRSLNNSSRAIYTQMESPLKSPPVSLSDA